MEGDQDRDDPADADVDPDAAPGQPGLHRERGDGEARRQRRDHEQHRRPGEVGTREGQDDEERPAERGRGPDDPDRAHDDGTSVRSTTARVSSESTTWRWKTARHGPRTSWATWTFGSPNWATAGSVSTR